MFKKFLIILVLCLTSSVMYAQSADVCEQMTDSPLDIDSQNLDESTLASAVAAYEEGDFVTADELFTELIGQDATNADLYLYRGCSLANLENYEDAYRDSMTYVGLVSFDTGADMDMSESSDTETETMASDLPELTETETVESPEFGGTLDVSYPEGWFVAGESGGFIISNNEEVLASTGPEDFEEIPEGTVIVTVTIIPGEMMGLMGIEGEVTPAAVIEVFSGFMAGEDMPEFGDIEELTINGNAAARTMGSDDKLSASLYAIDSDGNFTFGFGATRNDEAGQHEAIIQAIISSASFTPSE